MKRIRILIADDHSLMRIGLSTLLAGKKDLQIVGEACNGEDAISAARRLKPDVIVMDLMMPKVSGAAATEVIRRELPDVHILVLTTFGTSSELAEAVRNGASGALLKDTATDELITAVRTVAAGDRFFSSSVRAELQDQPEPLRLNERQIEILRSLTRGLTNQDIARQFGLSEISIKKYLTDIFARLGAANRTEAISIALRKHLLKM